MKKVHEEEQVELSDSARTEEASSMSKSQRRGNGQQQVPKHGESASPRRGAA